MKAGVYIVVIVAILIGAGFYLFYDGGDTENREMSLTPQAQYFVETIESGTVERVGQPIEGFEPQMFMLAFPGIVPSDFDGVEAEQGVYQVSNGAIAFVLTDSGPEHSAARAVTPAGMGVLLENIAARLDFPIDTDAGVRALLEQIDEVETEDVGKMIIGVWESTDDANFVRVFEENGTVTDTYEGDSEATSIGQWTILTDLSEEPPNIPSEEGMVYLKILFEEEAFYFIISEVDETSLQLIYLDRGGALNFERILEEQTDEEGEE